jgi:transposase
MRLRAQERAQQAVLALHRMRQQLIKFRTMQSNGLRGLLTEYGEVMAVGRAALNKAMTDRRHVSAHAADTRRPGGSLARERAGAVG